jgi:hypothetical protein
MSGKLDAKVVRTATCLASTTEGIPSTSQSELENCILIALNANAISCLLSQCSGMKQKKENGMKFMRKGGKAALLDIWKPDC